MKSRNFLYQASHCCVVSIMSTQKTWIKYYCLPSTGMNYTSVGVCKDRSLASSCLKNSFWSPWPWESSNCLQPWEFSLCPCVGFISVAFGCPRVFLSYCLVIDRSHWIEKVVVKRTKLHPHLLVEKPIAEWILACYFVTDQCIWTLSVNGVDPSLCKLVVWCKWSSAQSIWILLEVRM